MTQLVSTINTLIALMVLSHNYAYIYYYLLWLCSPAQAMASSFMRFRDHTKRRATVSRIPLDEWSAHRRDIYLTTHNTHNKHPPPRGIRTHNRSRRAAVDLRLRPHSNWDQQLCLYRIILHYLHQCFSTVGPRPGTGPWHQLYRAARGKYFIEEIFWGE
jgi:hypothetical protein